jgi:hypothetical protein
MKHHIVEHYKSYVRMKPTNQEAPWYIRLVLKKGTPVIQKAVTHIE